MFGSISPDISRCLQRHLDRVDMRVRHVQRHARTVVALERAAFDRAQKRLLVRRDHIDQLLLQRFLLGERLRLAHRALGHGHVAPALAAIVRMKAAASFSIFAFMISSTFSPRRTGCAAPVFVPGAIAATSADSRMKKPAEAARLPAARRRR